jgi:hypothetical protein
MGIDSYIQVPPDSTGKRLYTKQYTVGNAAVQGQVYHLADEDNPSYVQRVDKRGQASVRFADGSPSMSAFGELRVGLEHIVGGYEYTNGPMNDLFTDFTQNSGNIAYNATESTVTLSVTGTANSISTRTTNRYHYYQPGVGTLIIITLSMGDIGKAGNIREWGYGDDKNGLFWRLDGTEMQVVRRTNTSGTVEEFVVPQFQWNVDKLDGTGLSGMALDVTKANFYWVDFAWLGVGVVRFGVLAQDGSRWVCHEFENPNSNIGPYMATGSLPVRWHNHNTTATSGTSEMKTICSAVYAESEIDYTYWRFSLDSGAPRNIESTWTPLLTIRPKLSYNGKTNRVGIYPDSISYYIEGGAVQVAFIEDGILGNVAWTDGEETVEYDVSANTITGGVTIRSAYIQTGASILQINYFYETNDEGYHVLADGSDAYTLTVAARKMNPGNTVVASSILNYKELR